MQLTLTLHKQIRRLTKCICHLLILIADLLACCKTAKIDAKKLTHPIAMRWNSMTLAMQPTLDHLVDSPQHNSNHGPKLKQFKLTDEEWSFITRLNKILQVRSFDRMQSIANTNLFQYFLKTTECVSRMSTPLLHEP